MKRYDQWDQNSPITEVEFGRFALYGEAQDEFETMAKLCATKIEQQQVEIDRLTHRLFQMNKALEKERLKAEIDELQAKIDRLMLEFCPEEMTREQLDKWGECQKPVDKHKGG